MQKIDKFAQKRNLNFLIYADRIKNNELNIEIHDERFISNFAYPIVNTKRNLIINELKINNIESRPLIAGDISQKPMWTNKYGKLDLPNSAKINAFGFYIPNHQDLNFNDLELIINIINKLG
jgi:dTDP-4-amino-4,6-dideoxygalactose transaminase